MGKKERKRNTQSGRHSADWPRQALAEARCLSGLAGLPLPAKLAGLAAAVASVAYWLGAGRANGAPAEFTPEQVGEVDGASEPQSTIEECTFKKDFMSVEELFLRPTPCLVRGLEQKRHKALIKEWSPERLAALPASRSTMDVRLATGDSTTTAKTMRYSARINLDGSPEGDPYFTDMLNSSWPRHEYDDWNFKPGTLLNNILRPRDNSYASFSASASTFSQPHPAGSKTATDLTNAVCPFGCPRDGSLYIRSQIWVASRGLGQQLHFDPQANIFFHLHGEKPVILTPPEALIQHGHLHPTMHPSRAQSQVEWDSPFPERKLRGYSTAAGGDVGRPPPEYRRAMGEMVVHLKSLDVLYIPAFWGHQTFSGADMPTVSLACWFFPHAQNPADRPHLNANVQRGNSKGLDSVVFKGRAAVVKASAGQTWAGLRALGIALVNTMAPLFRKLGADKETGAAVLQRWVQQRWRPQFGGLGLDADLPPPAALCVPPSGVAIGVAMKAAGEIRVFMESMATWHLGDHSPLFMEYETMNALDQLLAFLPSFSAELASLGVKKDQYIGALLASFVDCPSVQK